MPHFTRSIILCSIFFATQLAFGQQHTSSISDKFIPEILQNADRSEFHYIPKKPGHYTVEQWREVIDSTWGEGMSTEKKLQFFDLCWNYIDTQYPSFFHIEDNWDSLITLPFVHPFMGNTGKPMKG